MTDLSLPPGIAIRMTAESLLHRGRMGLAYRARSGAGAEGVLRVLDPELSRAATDRMRLSRGLEKLMTVSHPSLVVPIEHGEDGGQLWYLRPYVSGVTLAERLAQGPLPLPEALSIGGQVADALHALHRAGLLHRDLCSERVVLQPDGRAVLIDATVAAPLGPEYDKVFGTAPFVSPEEVEGKPTSFRSDLYALGIMLYAAIAGEPPFEGNIPDVLEAHLQTAPPALEAGLSADVRALLDHDLALLPKMTVKTDAHRVRALRDLGLVSLDQPAELVTHHLRMIGQGDDPGPGRMTKGHRQGRRLALRLRQMQNVEAHRGTGGVPCRGRPSGLQQGFHRGRPVAVEHVDELQLRTAAAEGFGIERVGGGDLGPVLHHRHHDAHRIGDRNGFPIRLRLRIGCRIAHGQGVGDGHERFPERGPVSGSPRIGRALSRRKGSSRRATLA